MSIQKLTTSNEFLVDNLNKRGGVALINFQYLYLHFFPKGDNSLRTAWLWILLDQCNHYGSLATLIYLDSLNQKAHIFMKLDLKSIWNLITLNILMPLTPGMKIWIYSDNFWISYNMIVSRLMNEIFSDVLDIYIAVGSHGFFSQKNHFCTRPMSKNS